MMGRAGRTARSLVLIALVGIIQASTAFAQTARTIPLAWRYVPGGTLTAPPAGDAAGNAYFAAEDRYLYCVDRFGRFVFRYDLGRKVESGAVWSPQGSVISVTADGRLVATNQAGRRLFELPPPRPAGGRGTVRPFAPVILEGGIIINAYTDGTLRSVSPSGTVLWRLGFTDTITAAPLALDGGFVVATAGRIYALSDAGEFLWNSGYSGRMVALSASRRAIFLVDDAGTVTSYALDGTTRWRTSLGDAGVGGKPPRGPFTLAPGRDGSFYMLDADGRVYNIKPDGSRGFVLFLPKIRFTGLTVGWDDRLYAVTDGGMVLKMDAGGGVLESLVVPNPARLSMPRLLPSGQLVAGGDNWVVYAVQAATPLPAVANGIGDAGSAGVRRESDGKADGPPTSALPSPPDPSTGADYVYLRKMADSTLAADRGRAVDVCRDLLERAQLRGAISYAVAIVRDVAAYPYRNRIDSSGAGRFSDATDVRVSAVTLLGELGTSDARDALVALAAVEYDADVQKAIMRAMGRIAIDPAGAMQRALYGLLSRQRPTGIAESYARVLLDALDEIVSRGGGRDPVTLDTIDLFSRLPLPSEIRRRAYDVVRVLSYRQPAP